MSEGQQVPQRSICNCRSVIDQGTSEPCFRCHSCQNEHLLGCFQSIYETIDDTVYIETECRTCIVQVFEQRAQREVELNNQSLVSGTPTPVESEDEESSEQTGPFEQVEPVEPVDEPERPVLVQPLFEQSGEELPPNNVELEQCEICSRPIWYLTRSEWQILRNYFPEDHDEQVLCSDCDDDTSEEELLEREQFIRDLHEL